MTMHRKVNVRHKDIIVARKMLIYDYFSAKMCPKLFEINNFNLSCIGWSKFLQKIFIDWKIKAYF